MTQATELLEGLSVPAFLFQERGGATRFVSGNAEAHATCSEVGALTGENLTAFFANDREVLLGASRCLTERVAVTCDVVMKWAPGEATAERVRLLMVPAAEDHFVAYVLPVTPASAPTPRLGGGEARLFALLAASSDGVIVRARDGSIIHCNETFAQLFGAVSPDELIGRIDLLSSEIGMRTAEGADVSPASVPCRRVLSTGAAESPRTYGLTVRGTEHWVRVISIPTFGGDGTLIGSVATYTDVSDEVHVKSAVKEGASTLEQALAVGGIGVWQFDPANDLGWWSPNLDEIFGFRAKSRGYANFVAYVHPDDRLELMTRSARLMDGTEGEAFELEFRIVGDDEVTRWARLRGRLACAGRRRVLTGTLMDITERRYLEEELRRAQRLESIGRITGGVARDFNDFLAAILGSLELVEQECPLATRQDLANIRQVCLRARDLTRQLLVFAGKQPTERRIHELGKLVSNVELLLRRLVGPGVALDIQLREPALVRGDASLLEQVIVNLVLNARTAAESGGRISIEVSCHKNLGHPLIQGELIARLTVRDSGEAMDAESRRHAFDPFYTASKRSGGLGTASSYVIIQQLGGDITVDSDTKEGNAFSVVLPCLGTTATVVDQVSTPAVMASGEGALLIVDDEDVVRDTTARLAQGLGYQTFTAADPTEAQRIMTEHLDLIDLVICDIALSGGDGMTLAKALRQLKPGLRVLLMSGYVNDPVKFRLAKSEFLQKPFTRNELAERLSALLASR